jgi:hypothetical protein
MTSTYKVHLTIESAEEYDEAEPVDYVKYVKADSEREAEDKASDLAEADFVKYNGDISRITNFLSAKEVTA